MLLGFSSFYESEVFSLVPFLGEIQFPSIEQELITQSDSALTIQELNSVLETYYRTRWVPAQAPRLLAGQLPPEVG